MPIAITDYISTTHPSDIYATHDATMGRGGHRTVSTFQDMLAITIPRRIPGMQVHVLESDTLYRLSDTGTYWSLFTDNIDVLISTDLPTYTGSNAGDLVYLSDANVIMELDSDLTTWSQISTNPPLYYALPVADLTTRNELPLSARYENMIVHTLDSNTYYRLLSINFDTDGNFINDDDDWVEVDFDSSILVVPSVDNIETQLTKDIWPGRYIYIEDTNDVVIIRRESTEWIEMPFSDVPYYIIDSDSDLETVPPFYRRPGVQVYSVDETTIWTRSSDNSEWVPLTTGSTGLTITSATVDPDSGELIFTYSDGSTENVGVVTGEGRGITDATIDVDTGELTLTYSDGTSNSLGVVVGSDGIDGEDGVGIVSAIVNPVTGDLELNYSDGTVGNLGQIKGESGDAGVGVINVQLLEDPQSPGTVYFVTELSDGRILQSRDAISGYNGLSVAEVSIVNDAFVFTMENGNTLPPIPVDGLHAIGVDNVTITDGDLMIHYTDGRVESAGSANNLKGRGIDDLYIDGGSGDVNVVYSDSVTPVKIGEFYSIENIYTYRSGAYVVYSNSPTLSGVTDDPFEMVLVTSSEGYVIGETTSDEDGNWTFPDASRVGEHDSIIDMYMYKDNICVVYSSTNMITNDTPVDPFVIIEVLNTNGDAIGEVVTDADGNWEFLDADVLGQSKSIISTQLVDAQLQIKYSSDPDSFITVGELIGFTQAYINDDREVVFVTNKPDISTNTGMVEYNIGEVNGLRGKSLTDVSLVNNNLIFTLEGGVVLSPIPVNGLTPISVVGARVDENTGELYFELSNGTEIASGVAEDMRGRGIVSTQITNGRLIVTYDDNVDQDAGELVGISSTNLVDGDFSVSFTDGRVDDLGKLLSITHAEIIAGQLHITYNDHSTEIVGDVPGIAGFQFTDGMLSYSLTTDPTVEIDISILKSLDRAEILNGQLLFYFEHDPETPVVIGDAPLVTAARVAGNYLVFDYNDGRKNVQIGYVKGPRGYSITGAHVNDGGFLEVYSDDPDNQVYNAGFVRTSLQNLIGQTTYFIAEDSQTEHFLTHTGEALVFVNNDLLLPNQYSLDLLDRITFNTPLTLGDSVTIVVYAPNPLSETGRGIRSYMEADGLYTLLLEDGSTITIDTQFQVPPGIDNITVLPNGDIRVYLTDNTNFIAGSANNAVNITGASVDNSGDLIITTTDPANSPINAGSVLSGLQITSAEINESGELVFYTSDGTFNAGPAANYVTDANIEAGSGDLILSMSLGNDINAGTVRNPLLGMIHESTAFLGQTDFPFEHTGYDLVVIANGIILSKASVNTSTPGVVKLSEPRDSGDTISILALYTSEVTADSVSGADSADADTYYGKDISGTLGFHPINNLKLSQPNDIIASPGQVDFYVSHSGMVEVIIDGVYIMPENYTFPNYTRVRLNSPLIGGESVRINVLTSPVGTTGLQFDNYTNYKFLTNLGGGYARRGVWTPRQINTIAVNTINGASLDRNRMVLPGGTYYIRGWAAANSVGAHATRLYDLTTSSTILVGDSVFSGLYPSNTTAQNKNHPQIPNSHAPIEGYFTLGVQSALELQHRVLQDRLVLGALGEVGGGFANVAPATTGNPPSGSSVSQSGMGMSATLVNVQIWRVSP